MDSPNPATGRKYGYSKKGRDSYRVGFGVRVSERMKSLRAQRDAAAQARAVMSSGTSLLVVKDQIVTQEFEKLGVKLTQRAAPQIRDRNAYASGHAHGNSVNLNNPLEDGRGVVGALR